MTSSMKRQMKTLFGAAVLLGALASCAPQRLDSFLYDPLPSTSGCAGLAEPSCEDVFVDSTDGARVHVALAKTSGPHPEVTMLYFHGQSNNVTSSWPRVALLAPLGVNLAAVDPRGYGLSTGTPSERGIHDDLMAVWDALARRPDLDATKFVIYGRSLGAAFATDLAAVRTPMALVTESAFASIAYMVKDGVYVDLPPGFVADSRWDNLARISHMPAPYLAFHGTSDDYVRYQYSEWLTAAHKVAFPGDEKTLLVLVAGANHGDAHGPPPTLGQDEYLGELRAFLKL
jgi:dipeptidyl aminopeptidase/acylaminoacyl peptidase